MAALSLLGKDVREHRSAVFFLSAGCLVVVMLLLAQNAAAAYSMSAFEIVRFSLISLLPLVALIIGNRLIVREYLSGTRLFVEALPMGPNLPLVLKYLLGFLYLASLSSAMILLAAQQAGIADDVTLDYVMLIVGKTLVMVSLYWSIVFCFSLCGYLRIALYALSAAIVALIAFYPGIDSSRFAPFALMDDQLFVYERDIVPWIDIAITLLMSLAFTVAGFVLSRIGEGSVVERLAKPMTRRDYVALGVLFSAGLAVWSTLVEENQRAPVDFSSSAVIRLSDPSVSVLYLDSQYKESAQELANRTTDSLLALQATLGLSRLPDVRLSLTPGREKHDIDYATRDGVFISANWLEHDSYDDAILDTVLLHGVLSAQTGGRAVFEPYHWVLDGFTRWWVEQGNSRLRETHRSELLARALWALDREPQADRLIRRWQLIADRFAYPSAEALAWVAMTYIEQEMGRETVIALAAEFLTQPMGSSLSATLKDRREGVQTRVERIVGMPIDEFHRQWRAWLQNQRDDPQIQSLLAFIPALKGSVVSEIDEFGTQQILASYVPLDEGRGLATDISALDGLCIIKHDYLGPFDTEFEVSKDYESSANCDAESPAHEIRSIYATGDRVFIALDYEGSVFHQPLRLHAERLTIR
ncbi:MAG: hypothetical protein AB8B79_10585 [Granulosicoccus sp.]